MDVATYQMRLARCWYSYQHEERLGLARFGPAVNDVAIKAQLINVIRNHLGEFIDGDDHIQSATLGIDGGTDVGFRVDHLLSHWLDIALVRGSAGAAAAFLEDAHAGTVPYQTFTMIRGASADQEVAITECTRLVPMPSDPARLPPHLPPSVYPNVDTAPWMPNLDGSALLVTDMAVSPSFVNPSSIVFDNDTPAGWVNPFIRTDARGNSSGLNEKQFCEALSLIVGCAIIPAARWSYLSDDHLCAIKATSGGTFYTRQALAPGPSTEITKQHVGEAMRLYHTRRALPDDVTKRLDIPLSRWIESHTNRSLVDKFIDMGVALESLYLQGSTSELRFRLALHVAWHLEDDPRERLRLMKGIREVYDLRSRAAHSGTIIKRGGADVVTLLELAQDCCRRGITKVINDGGSPDWDSLIVGEAG